MKVITKLLMLLVLLAICAPSYGDATLIYNVRQQSTYKYGSDLSWSSYKYRSSGYLATYFSTDANEIVDVNDTTLMEFGKSKGGSKWFSQSDPNLDFKNVGDVNDADNSYWAFCGGTTWALDDEAAITALWGEVTTVNISVTGVDSLNIAPNLTGETIVCEPGDGMGMSNYFKREQWRLRLNQKLTNHVNKNALNKEETEEYLIAQLEGQGYPADSNSM